MNQNDAFPSNYLKSTDVSGHGEPYVMDSVKIVEFTDPQTQETSEKPVLSFSGTEKALILNKTNWKRIAKLFGEESDLWKDKTITLRLEAVEAFGKTSDVIRVAV